MNGAVVQTAIGAHQNSRGSSVRCLRHTSQTRAFIRSGTASPRDIVAECARKICAHTYQELQVRDNEQEMRHFDTSQLERHVDVHFNFSANVTDSDTIYLAPDS